MSSAFDFFGSKAKDFNKELFSIKGKKGVFTILMTATVLIIFEIIFFYKIVAPNVENEMKHNIKIVARDMASTINEKNKTIQNKSPIADVVIAQTTDIVFSDVSKGVLKTLENREKILIDDINNYTIYTGVILVLTMAIFLFIIWNSIQTDTSVETGTTVETGSDKGDHHNTDMTTATLTAMMTVGVLIGFQVLFYFFGKEYRYPGTKGKEELAWEIISSIDTSAEIQQQASKEIMLENTQNK